MTTVNHHCNQKGNLSVLIMSTLCIDLRMAKYSYISVVVATRNISLQQRWTNVLSLLNWFKWQDQKTKSLISISFNLNMTGDLSQPSKNCSELDNNKLSSLHSSKEIKEFSRLINRSICRFVASIVSYYYYFWRACTVLPT